MAVQLSPSSSSSSAAVLLFAAAAVTLFGFAAGEPAVCTSEERLFLSSIDSRCAAGVPPSVPVEVDGEFANRILSFQLKRSYTSVLFYSSRCPFSLRMRAIFEALSSMFPQIAHLAVEESKVMPVVFSKQGIHSLPVLVIVNQTSRIRYYGSKDLDSFVLFYKRIAGVHPSELFSRSVPITFDLKWPLLWELPSGELLKREPYFVFSLLFVCLIGFVYFFPDILSQIKSFWISHIWYPNLSFFWETSQALSRVLHLIDIKRIWSKVKLCKTRNFQNGTTNVRVWASSFASVSLGKSCSTRSVGGS